MLCLWYRNNHRLVNDLELLLLCGVLDASEDNIRSRIQEFYYSDSSNPANHVLPSGLKQPQGTIIPFDDDDHTDWTRLCGNINSTGNPREDNPQRGSSLIHVGTPMAASASFGTSVWDSTLMNVTQSNSNSWCSKRSPGASYVAC
jgi:hypothetical protein